GSARWASISRPACNDGANKLAPKGVGCWATAAPAHKAIAIKPLIFRKSTWGMLANAFPPIRGGPVVHARIPIETVVATCPPLCKPLKNLNLPSRQGCQLVGTLPGPHQTRVAGWRSHKTQVQAYPLFANEPAPAGALAFCLHIVSASRDPGYWEQ